MLRECYKKRDQQRFLESIKAFDEEAKKSQGDSFMDLDPAKQTELVTRINKHLPEELAAKLTAEFGRGFSPANLSHMRRFFLVWKERVRIFQQPTENLRIEEKGQQPAGELAAIPVSTQPVRKSPFTLNWTHYVLLLTSRIADLLAGMQ